MKILVTGCAGFVGFHLATKLLKEKNEVFGIDNINNYYDIKLKKSRLSILKQYKKFNFNKFDLLNYTKLNNLIKKNNIKYVVHLAAQAGVRYSIENPKSYFKNNLEVFFNILESSRNNNIKHFIFASTSSVYGENKKFPLNEKDNTDKPISFYASTKKSNEVLAHSYSYIYNLPCTGLRFFTVYGPYGRPDMALFKFTKNILENKKVDLYNNGNHLRDFTYIDDIIDGINTVIKKPNQDKVPYNIFNIGNGTSRQLKDYLFLIEKKLDLKAKIKKMPLQKGDIIKTHSDINSLSNFTNYKAKTNIEEGVGKFVNWFLEYYKY
ncbi:NAD-dependent epimerase/dehydratase family protein [Alphaproteobacteria bacterium]|jgi:UDP-glucuronate 4-epimerase|nr:NAD-dependent epimerase/dehydratase family protein [Alphaproteobacteria bacterium]MDC3270076.1 NAD-dependent epimerase/dehydratase family protein [Alphaproteobacteria bacterium]